MKTKFTTNKSIEIEAQRQINLLAEEKLASIEQTFAMRTSFFFQQVLAAIVLAVFAIPMLLIYMLVRLGSPGPGIFEQVRVGLNGKIFTMYKFRTMSVKAELNSGPVWSPGNSDPRLTNVGKFLRFVHLDELPQLWNVVKGEMSLIGPRPERPVFVIMLSEQVEGYLDRLQVRPGITGLAQVYLDADISIQCVQRKIVFDKLYIRSQSALLNLQIACCTMVRMLGIRNGRGPRWFGLNRQCVRAGIIKANPVAPAFFPKIKSEGTRFDSDRNSPVAAQALRPHFIQCDDASDSISTVPTISNRKPK